MVARVGRGACGRLLPGCGHAMGFSMVGATVDIPPSSSSTRTRLSVFGPGEGSAGRQTTWTLCVRRRICSVDRMALLTIDAVERSLRR